MVCRERRDDSVMIRAGRTAQLQWHVGRGSGRGVWWCRDGACGSGLRVGLVARALRVEVSESEVEALRVLR